jgi:hypothetical protein
MTAVSPAALCDQQSSRHPNSASPSPKGFLFRWAGEFPERADDSRQVKIEVSETAAEDFAEEGGILSGYGADRTVLYRKNFLFAPSPATVPAGPNMGLDLSRLSPNVLDSLQIPLCLTKIVWGWQS